MQKQNVIKITFEAEKFDTIKLFSKVVEWLKKNKDFMIEDISYQADDMGERIILYGIYIEY